jgi:trans-aconitate methyltransferase
MRARVGGAFFEALYAENPDPWDFETSAYERAKYDATIAALDGRYATGLEIGCSIGVLTQRLVEHVGELLSIDVAEAALERARKRNPQVRFERREIPEEFPEGEFELVVASEVLYYLDAPALEATLDRIEHGTLLAVHWRHPTERYPFTGDEVHERLRARYGRSAHHRETPDYVLDRFELCGC